MSLQSIPVELLHEIADNLLPTDIFSLIRVSRRLYDGFINRLYVLAGCYRLQNPKPLTEALRDVSFWHDKEGNGTVLEWAAVHDCLPTFNRVLNEKHVDLVQEDSYGVTLLHRLASEGKVDFMKSLIPRLVETSRCLSQTDLSGLTPLHFAAGCGKEEVVRLLITQGANANDRDHHGNTPIHLAAVTGKSAVFSTLVNAGAAINSQTRLGWRAVDMASIANHTSAVDQLLILGSEGPTWRYKQYALNEYVRLSPCPLEYYFENLELAFQGVSS
jgi:ankyrin repeat protein